MWTGMVIRHRSVRIFWNSSRRKWGISSCPEYIIDQGYMNNTYRIPSKEFQDFQAFQRREVAKVAKEMVDITHECGRGSYDVHGRSLDRYGTIYG